MTESTVNEPIADQGLAEERELEAELTKAFPSLAGRFSIQRARRVWVEADLDIFEPLFADCVERLDFAMLCTITGTDDGEKLGMIYHLARNAGLMLNITVRVARGEPGPNTVMGFFPVAELYEREVVDLLGITVQGLPEGPRYPLPDDWPAGQYPLRKEWKADQLKSKGAGEKGGANVEEAKK